MGKMAERKRYDEGFKRHVLELYESGQRPAELAETYAIHPTTISNWVKYYKNSGSFNQKDNQTEDQKRIKEQEKLIKKQQMEIDILKKAMKPREASSPN